MSSDRKREREENEEEDDVVGPLPCDYTDETPTTKKMKSEKHTLIIY